MSGGFFYEHIVDAVLNLQQQSKPNNEKPKPKENSVKKLKKK